MDKALFAITATLMTATAAFADGAAAGQSNPVAAFFPLIIFVVIFYFFVLRPQKKRQKTHDNLVNSLQRGDRVVTAGGFYAIVREVKEDSVIIDLAEGLPVRIAKGSISAKINPDAKPAGKKDAKAAKAVEAKTEEAPKEEAPVAEEPKAEGQE